MVMSWSYQKQLRLDKNLMGKSKLKDLKANNWEENANYVQFDDERESLLMTQESNGQGRPLGMQTGKLLYPHMKLLKNIWKLPFYPIL